MIKIKERTNRVLNIVKAKYGLNDKSAAIDLVVQEYEDVLMEPELRPEFIKRMRRISKNKKIHVGTVDDLRKIIGLK